MTQSWRPLVSWKDISETQITLKDKKESNHVDVSEFAKNKGIYDEPVFACWFPYTLIKRDVIISSINSRVKKTHKYGIKIPASVYHAYKPIKTKIIHSGDM